MTETIHTTPRPKSGKTTYHRDGSVTLWDVYRQQWTRTEAPSDQVLASLGSEERERVMRHCGMTFLASQVEPSAASLRCVSDRYDSDGSVPYDSLEDFLAMCRDVHGEAPELTEHDGCYYEGDTLVLEICDD